MKTEVRVDFNKDEIAKSFNDVYCDNATGEVISYQETTRGIDYSVREVGLALHQDVSNFIKGRQDKFTYGGAESVYNLIVDHTNYPIFWENRRVIPQGRTYLGSEAEIRISDPRQNKELESLFATKRSIFTNLVGNWIREHPEIVSDPRLRLSTLFSKDLRELQKFLLPLRVKRREGEDLLFYEPTARADILAFTNLRGDKFRDYLCQSAAELCNSGVNLHNIDELRNFKSRFLLWNYNGQEIMQKIFEQTAMGNIGITIGDIKSIHGDIARFISNTQTPVINQKYEFDLAHTALAFREAVNVAYYGKRGIDTDSLFRQMAANMQFQLYFQPYFEENGGLVYGQPVCTNVSQRRILDKIEEIPNYL